MSAGLKYCFRRALLRWWGWRWPGLSSLLGYQIQQGLVCEPLCGAQFQYDPRTYIGQCLFTGVGFEDCEIDFIAARLATHSTPLIVDVGANIGWHTVRWATQLATAHIYSFEPNANAADTLESNLRLNQIETRVSVVRCAVAEVAGTRALIECEDGAYSSMLDTGRSPVHARRQVPVITLDDFVKENNISALALLKVDVEGLEWEVVQGAAHTLRHLKPDLFIEIDERNRASPTGADLIRALLGYGYRAFVFRGGRLESTHPDEYKFWFYNYFFTTDPSFRC